MIGMARRTCYGEVIASKTGDEATEADMWSGLWKLKSGEHSEVVVTDFIWSADLSGKVEQVGKVTLPPANFKGALKQAFAWSKSHSAAPEPSSECSWKGHLVLVCSQRRSQQDLLHWQCTGAKNLGC